ncbi:hypothetical protein [Sphingopyxis terrae]|uniref:hypothetical protein n=1 Tax=Sphingopyxis terrae TaxID=33052 RepID=UPI0013C41A17|nr:hypothetical protein [Sphingopyxis terrae]
MKKAIERGPIILRLAGKGLSNVQIAKELGLSRDRVLACKREYRAFLAKGDQS